MTFSPKKTLHVAGKVFCFMIGFFHSLEKAFRRRR